MNTNKLKAYAPKARLAFMDAVKKRAAVLGIYENKISEALTQGTDTLIEGRIFTRKQGQQRQQLVNRIEALGGGKDGYNQFINEMAFTWFNRFTAIRFMEVNGYLDHGFRMLSKEEDSEFGQGFEILAHAADVAEDLGLNKADIVEMLLAGDKEEELYRELLLAQCHQLSKIMPFMFEKLDDATELLLPDNLTKTDSILKELVNDVPEDNWREIEVIGWLYQFYISEHKDAVIGKVVKKEDIPAATQLFTPNWIVKYLVQNSLGRQWLATYPDSDLKEKMEYYITPAEQSDDVIEQLKAITPTSIDPERIKVLDPACGSGHILVEVYEVLREIYLERGYRLREIPELILTKNIYGLDIDDRAAQMAAFAVLMKAREDDRRIFSRIEDNQLELNIHSIQSTEHLDINKLWSDLDLDGNKQAGFMDDLFAEPQLEVTKPSTKNQQYLDLLRYLKEQFIDAKNIGSLIEIDTKYTEILSNLKLELKSKNKDNNPSVRIASETILPFINQALMLVFSYDFCIANPPYLGNGGMNPSLKQFGKKKFDSAKANLFSMFMLKGLDFVKTHGHCAFMTPISWMSLSSYEKLRSDLISKSALTSFVQPEYNAFWDSAHVAICSFIYQKEVTNNYIATCINLAGFFGGNIQAEKLLDAVRNNNCSYKYRIASSHFKKIPGMPIAYWMKGIDNFTSKKVSASFESGGRNKTHNNEKYLRFFWEIKKECSRWVPYANGGNFRKYSGNDTEVVDWSDSARSFYSSHGGLINDKYWNKEGICWSLVTSAITGVRIKKGYQVYSSGSPTIFNSAFKCDFILLAYLNSPLAQYYLKAITPTVNTTVKDIFSLPYDTRLSNNNITNNTKRLIEISDIDDSLFEINRNFKKNPLVSIQDNSIGKSFTKLIIQYSELIDEYRNLEEENNLFFHKHHGLSDEVSHLTPKENITLKCNKFYRYNGRVQPDQQTDKLQSETIYELVSYSLGCMMGRFSLDREGLVYAHSGNHGFKELVAEGAYKTFPADDDGIIPLAAEDWLFEDDATSRFRDFVKTVWGEEHLQENLDFVAESLCLDAIKPKKNESSMETIRRYFSTQFYKDHLKTYKKRPIYWLFSSGKEKAFECLVYLHRYNESTLARMRTEYVTPLMGKLETQNSVLTESRTNASSTEQRRIDKELKSIEKKQSELRAFDEELKHLAEMKISIDLDDGVKVNYGKFGNLLADVKAIHGKNPEEIK
ncbi:BREX-1 system adenine-specific DNA-methyltransferase PglX [Vibrio parahaemolyticus]|nr:BREX-1 system adenine-specific DNA-methyltransferase PglX [Vibrio parahaemolyticus]